MNLSEQELRDLVRDVVRRQKSASASAAAPAPSPAQSCLSHASHGRLTLVGDGDPEGRCQIEPAVACTHCGYCQSLGH
ncbi:MAG: hypothetical protein LBQ09_10205 [Acidobacteriaceae bacterium]|nr:hypothetical protein [Acidobacteriaceae bacterium]